MEAYSQSSALVQGIGYVAATLTTVAFFPQVLRTWRSGIQEMSLVMLLLFGTGVGLWLGYGVLIGAAPVIIANGLTAAQIVTIAILGRRSRSR